MKLPGGFESGGAAAGIKASGRPDLALIYSPYDLDWAYTSTQNQVRAPCVTRNRARYSSGQSVRAVIINSGIANCATGERGIWDNEDMAGAAANALGLPMVQDVLTASTGVIGQPLHMEKIRTAMPELARTLGSDTLGLAEAMMTTDLRRKQASFNLRGGSRIVGVAKGSGMIHPNMATMLAFVMTDAKLGQDRLRELWPGMVDRSFNQVTVDGDTSTNDMALLLSSRLYQADIEEFKAGLESVIQQLAQKIARDGEGATKLLSVEVRGARSEEEARAAARAVVLSPLVKAAAHGNDPNWGRIYSALGATRVIADFSLLTISVQGVLRFRGEAEPFDAEEVSEAMDDEELLIEIDLAAGESSGTAWGCDLSADYVRINADYHT